MAKDFEGLEGQMLVDALLAEGCTEVEARKSSRMVYVDTSDNLIALECNKCKTIKYELEFSRDRKGFYGKRSQCKFCVAERDRIYCENNRERYAECTRKWQQDNPEYIRNYYANNRGRFLGRSRNWRENNRQHVAEYMRDWLQDNAERSRLIGQRRRSVKRLLPDTETIELREKAFDYYNNTCALTGQAAEIHADHVIPLAIGHGGTIQGNMIPLSATLNISKSDRHIFEWFESNAERLGLHRSKFDALIAYLAGANEMTTAEYRAYVDWCFDNPRVIDEATGELVFRDGPINERNNDERKAIV